jgi:hypothetical protein
MSVHDNSGEADREVPALWLGIERAVNEWRAAPPLSIIPDSCGSQVLAMPEMQALRTWVAWARGWLEYIDDDGAEPLLPESVIAWVDDHGAGATA